MFSFKVLKNIKKSDLLKATFVKSFVIILK